MQVYNISGGKTKHLPIELEIWRGLLTIGLLSAINMSHTKPKRAPVV